MTGVKPWQIVVIGLGLLAGSASVFYSCRSFRDPVQQATEAQMVDIHTGDLFVATFPDGHPVSFPAKNPTTSELTLYPVYQRDNKWLVSTRYLSEIRKDKSVKAGLLVDGKSGEIKVASEKPKRADVFGR